MPMHRFLVLLALVLLGGCAKQASLPETVVSAASPAEFADFRAELAKTFPAEQLQAFDTAVQELKLDALNRDVPAAQREADMCARINGRTVQVALVLGWKARATRFHREIAEVQKILDDAQQAKDRAAASGAPLAASVPAQIQSAGTMLDQLNRNLAETERRLAEWRETAR